MQHSVIQRWLGARKPWETRTEGGSMMLETVLLLPLLLMVTFGTLWLAMIATAKAQLTLATQQTARMVSAQVQAGSQRSVWYMAQEALPETAATLDRSQLRLVRAERTQARRQPALVVEATYSMSGPMGYRVHLRERSVQVLVP